MSRQFHARNIKKSAVSGSGLRFGGIVALCLVLLYTALILWHVQLQQKITSIMKFIGHSQMMSIMVFLLIIIGGVMFALSWKRISSELAVLKERRDENLSRNANPEQCYTWLKEHKKEHTLIYRRLDVLLAGQVNTRGEKKLSSMSDLHEITLQRELSNWDSAGLNTIISFLLILGILGTLTGVHGVLAADDYETLYADKYGIKLLKLAPALSPSAFAVLGTVLLMICRAWYLRFVDSYLGLLDEVTMTSILPCLSRPRGQSISDGWDELTKNLKGMEALEVPDFPDDSEREVRWNAVQVAGKVAEAQVAQLKELQISSDPEAPLPPNPPTQFLASHTVHSRLTMEHIRRGEELCAMNERKLKD